jgi:hypothetical protein
MKTIFEHIDRVKAKPHHIRKQIAFVSAAVGAGLIALVWLVGSVTTGAFSIKGSSFAANAEQGSTVTAGGDTSGNQNLAGVGAAAALPDASVPAHIEIIDAASATAGQKQAEQTTIPF